MSFTESSPHALPAAAVAAAADAEPPTFGDPFAPRPRDQNLSVETDGMSGLRHLAVLI